MWNRFDRLARILFNKDEGGGGTTHLSDGEVVIDYNDNFELDFNDLYGEDIVEDSLEDSESGSEEVEELNVEGDETLDNQLPEDETESESQESESSEVSDTTAESSAAESTSEETTLTELDLLKQQVASLTEALNNVSSGNVTGEPKVSDPQQVEVPPESTPDETVAPLDLKELFKDIDVTTAVDSEEGFLGLLGHAIQIAEDRAYKRATQENSKVVPNIVNTVIKQNADSTKLKETFYKEHKELVPVESYVGVVAQDLHSKNPTWDITQVLTQTAIDVKEALNIQPMETKESTSSPQSTKTTKTKTEPQLPGNTTSRPTTQTVSGLQSEIDDFLKD